MSSIITTRLAAVALITASGALQASVGNSFKALDTDADGYISAAEAAANPDLHTRWNELDKDSNNQLDQSEFSAFETGTDNLKGKGGMMHDGTMPDTTDPLANPQD